jgi:heme/copper-type cytochrome/quinol oxidase subunit 3
MYHISDVIYFIFATIFLGLLFLGNQFIEVSLPLHIFSLASQSAPLFLVQVHALHISLGTFLLVIYAYNSIYTLAFDYFADLAILY